MSVESACASLKSRLERKARWWYVDAEVVGEEIWIYSTASTPGPLTAWRGHPVEWVRWDEDDWK